MNRLFVSFVVFLNYLVTTSANEVLGCEGFIKSHVPIDFSKVEVKLMTKQGIIKDKTTAAPNNGYYFVPLYDKGELILQLSPPTGWSFEPQKVELSVDGVSDLCSQGKDINFVFQGFGITGKVESLDGDGNGPEGVAVQLESRDDKRNTVTDSSGSFFFTPVFPGNYTVSITHPKWKIFKKSVEVQVAESNTELRKRSLIIHGYDVKVKVTSDGEPVKGATAFLFSKIKDKNPLVEGCSKEPLGVKFANKILCHATSNEAGEFIFGTVPSGDYYVTPHYQGQNIYFLPEAIDFTVTHNSLELAESFEIIGFSIPGKVVKTKNVPIKNAKIFLNGQEVTKTNANGGYKLEKMKAGSYKLRAEAENVIFEEIVIKINPTLQELPDLIPSAFKVCGEVTSDHSQIITFSKVGSTTFVQTETSPKDGVFCQYLSPGKYVVQVIVNHEDKQKGLQFFPVSQTIEVTSDIVSNIVFSQLKAEISGEVQCIRLKDCDDVTVVLKTENENETIAPIQDNSFYSVKNMYPGTYEVSLLPNKFCWKSDKHTVNVNAALIKVPPFIQQGYTITFVSSHKTQVHFKIPGKTTKSSFDIVKGRSNYCLENPGLYQFELDSCHSYNPKTISYNTDSEVNEVLLTAQKHNHKLQIQANNDLGNIQVSLKIGTVSTDKILKYNNGLYELDILLEPSETAVITPQSDTLFFTPPTLLLEGTDDCNNFGVKFVAVKGKLFKGKVIPILAGVTITVESPDSEALVVETDSNGVFKFPPLDNKKEYKISAKKDSYVLTGPDNNGNFLAHKLAEIIVEVLDGADRSPLSGVLLSLSGGESYRRNLQSGENGKISFHSLSPSEYFLRPMMKEYTFEPQSKIIPVKEGETVNVQLIGKRVAYSAFGQVVSLNGEPEDNMVIVASGIGNCSHFSEDTTCEATGQFRIRGLQPYCSYQVSVKGSLNEKTIVERTAPDFIEIDKINRDKTNLKLVILRPVSQMDILVKVYAENVDHYKSLKVKLTRELGSSVVHTSKIDTTSMKLTKDINPGILIYMISVPIDHRSYSVQLESNLVQNSKWKPQIHTFSADTSFKFIELNFNVKSNISEQSIKQTSIWSLVIIFSILFALYNIELIADILRDKFNFNISGLTNLIPIPTGNQKGATDFYDNEQIDQIVQSINNVKRKPKPKKA